MYQLVTLALVIRHDDQAEIHIAFGTPISALRIIHDLGGDNLNRYRMQETYFEDDVHALCLYSFTMVNSASS